MAAARELTLLVPGMHCAGCLGGVERALLAHPGVLAARANLTARQVSVSLERADTPADELLARLGRAGFEARALHADAAAALRPGSDDAGLIRALAVAGFAAANVMLLSVSVWAGADAASRELFHWISALIALPAIAYAGRPFFRSAAGALGARRLNMDVPISLAVILAAGMSLYQTTAGAEHAWFDAAVTLLFFLLAGRVLDARMRGLMRAAAARLLGLAPGTAHVIGQDGATSATDSAKVAPGAVIRIAPGDKIPLDGVVIAGASDLDRSALTGETLPEAAAPGTKIHAGTMNLTGALEARVTHAAADSLLAGIARLMQAAESHRGAYVVLADRAAAIYAPAVHLLAGLSFAGWLIAGAGFYEALTIAVAVLVITCPCALGLAVPAAQVVASGVLLRRGIFIKDGAALERLAEADRVVFDKTGTLTRGRPVMTDAPPRAGPEDWRLVLALAQASRHPLAQALAAEARRRGTVPARVEGLREEPGCGVEARHGGNAVRLGRRGWAAPDAPDTGGTAGSELWLCRAGATAALCFGFCDELKADAAQTVACFERAGLAASLLSGDRAGVVEETARRAGISCWRAAATPADKIAEIEALTAQGRRVLMLGDGINDAPALAAAHVSMAPASGSDITQSSADIVFTGDRLAPAAEALAMARATRRVILQNFTLALAYNLVAVPLAVAGYATPLLAAIAMSTSSLLVTANALRLNGALDSPPRQTEGRGGALAEAAA